MDDGKRLLDVISDPQALKEFFRSTSQIAFVEGKVPPITDESKPNSSKDISRSDSTALLTCNSHVLNSSSSGHLNKQTSPLAHFPFPSSSADPQGNILANVPSVKNGQQNKSSSLSTASNLRGVSVNSTNLLTSLSSNQNATSLSSSKPISAVSSSGTTFANSPMSFAFNDANKARNILSSGSVSFSTVDKPITVSPKQNQQPQNIKATPPRLVSSPQAGLNPTILSQNLKGSPLPILRPKGVVHRPQNAAIPRPSDQLTSQITIQGNVLTQGLKTTPMKGQPQLVAIRPKLIIGQSNATGLNNQSNVGTSNTRIKPSLQSSFTLGAKAQPQLPKQILNSLTVPQLQSGISNQPIGKSGLASLVQLQPKQIAPKPETVQAVGKSKLSQDQAHLQLVQSLLAQQSQTQFGLQSNVGTGAQKDLKQATSLNQENSTQQQIQQNQLKKLLKQNQLVQQAMQARAQQQHTQQHTQHTKQQLTQQTQQQHTKQQQTQQIHAQQQQQNMTLLQLKSSPTTSNSLVTSQQHKLPASQTSISTSNLAIQLKEAINTKQLQQFLEKNPIVAQQLKQLNMRQASLTGNTRQPGLTANTVSSTAATPVKTVTHLPKPAVTVAQLQKPTITQLQKPANIITSIAHLQKPVTSIPQLVKPAATTVTHLTTPTPKKLVTATTGQVTQKTDQKPVTTQKVVIVQQANTGTAAISATQPKVLLQTKEGRPILLSQEQFRQIQAQLASKNLTIQGKLVTAAPVTTTTATTVKPQVVVKSEASTPKVSQKVVPVTAKPQIKQETTKAAKRPIKAVETEESKLIKRMKLTVQKDQNDVCVTDIHKPFKTQQDAIKRLTPYHVYSEPIPNARMQRKANMLLDKLALQLTYKSDKMINKYRQLLLGDMQRDVPSAEVVMVNRIFLADEKAALLKDKKAVLEEARQMAQSTRATLALGDSNSSETTTNNQSSTFSTLDDRLQMETSEPAQIEISDDDSSPITSANSFLTHVTTRTNYNVVNTTLEPG